VCFKKVLKEFFIKKIDNFKGQCYIPLVISIKLCLKEKMGYPKKHRGRRKQGSKKRRAKRKNKKK
tara:strand:+ start:326 stop:520 length:195 start_codon:yes stop_codon:yes gene_type:complete